MFVITENIMKRPVCCVTIVQNFTKPETCKILHYWHTTYRTFIVTCFIAVCFEEILLSAAWRRRDISAETCRNYVKDCKHKLWNSAFVGVTWVIYFNYLTILILSSRPVFLSVSIIQEGNFSDSTFVYCVNTNVRHLFILYFTLFKRKLITVDLKLRQLY
jgi:hypothetical protein